MSLRSSAVLMLFALAACTTTPSTPPAALAGASPEQMVASVRAAGGSGEGELSVQPLRDPMVEDLRQKATRLEAQKRHADAAAALDQAIAITPDDPALLQERAEAALLLKDYDRAGQLAQRAFELGSQVGPLCRRHWATIMQVRLVQGDAAGAASARTQVEGCRIPAPARY